MKPLLAILVIVIAFAFPAKAAKPITRELANNYYTSCMSRRDERMTKESQAALCSCTSARMMEQMSVEDVGLMAETTQQGREKLNHLLIAVYAPCMRFPVSDLVSSQCLTDQNIHTKGIKIDRPRFCGCMGEKMGAWFDVHGSDLMTGIVRLNAGITDPIGPVMDSPAVRKETYNTMVTCLEETGALR